MSAGVRVPGRFCSVRNEVLTESLGFEWEGLSLIGDLCIPDSGGQHPVVVMIQGSGPADRTGNGYFPPIRDAFLARGIATFAFDKPGCGESDGCWRDYALESRADQVVTAIETVREQDIIDGGLVGLWRQSQGGWLVQMPASRLPDLRFAIANSGPSISLPDQDLYGCEHSMRAQGPKEAEIEKALHFVFEIHEVPRDDIDYNTFNDQLFSPARTESWYGYMTIDDAQDWQLICSFVNEQYEPVEALRRIRRSFLAVYGGRDVLVPAWQCASESGQALQQAINPDATIVVFPDGDHRIRKAGTLEFADGYVDLLATWTAHRTSSSPQTTR